MSEEIKTKEKDKDIILYIIAEFFVFVNRNI